MPQSRHRKRKGKKSAQHTQTLGAALSKQQKIIVLVIVLTLLLAGAVYLFMSSRSSQSGTSATQGTAVADSAGMVTTATGLQYLDLVEGIGTPAQVGKNVTVHYTGRLSNGVKFDSSLDRGQPYSFQLGRGVVIKGWDEGLQGMKVGGKRKLIIPPTLAYGAMSRPNIPANSTLIFEVELLNVKESLR